MILCLVFCEFFREVKVDWEIFVEVGCCLGFINYFNFVDLEVVRVEFLELIWDCFCDMIGIIY